MGKSAIIILFILQLTVCYGEGNDIRIGVVGDICFDGIVKKSIEEYGKDAMFYGYEEEITKSDMIFANLETTITERGSRVQGKKFTFRSSPEMLKVLKKNRIGIVSIANNHIVDYGEEGFCDTLDNLRKYGVLYSGAGKNRKETTIFPVYIKNGIKIGFIAFSKVIPYREWNVDVDRRGIRGIYPQHEKEAMELIKAAKSRCDILIVSVHWGIERSDEPRKNEIVLAKKMIDSGADIIMGHHTHTVQRLDYYKGKPIFYSLGNFVFGKASLDKANRTAMGVITIGSDKKIKKAKLVRGKLINNFPVSYSGKLYKMIKEEERKRKEKKSIAESGRNNGKEVM